MIVISCCNEEGGIFTINEHTLEVRKVVDREARGLAIDGEYIFATGHGGIRLYRAKNWELIIDHKAEQNWHGIAIKDAEIYSAVSRNHTIMRFDKLLRRMDPIKYDLPAGYPNDICFFNDDLYYCLPNQGAVMRWPHSEPIMRGLNMPHSLAITYDHIYTCNSGTGLAIRFGRTMENSHFSENKHEVVLRVLEYTRGICLGGEYVWVGLSKHRRSDKNKFRCGVMRKHLNTEEETFIELPAIEVYDIQKM